MLHRNLEWKLAAVILSIALWAFVTVSEQMGERAFRVPIDVSGIPRGLAVMSAPGEAVVLLRGDHEALEVAANQVQAHARLLEEHPGKVKATIEPIYPAELTQVRVTPQEISLQLDKVARHTFPINCQFQGDLDPGYTLGRPVIKPVSATVSGAQNLLARVDRVVVRIDTSYAMLGHPQSGLLAAVDPGGQPVAGLKIEPQTATVTVPVQSNIASKVLPVFVTLIGSPAEGYRARVTITPTLVTAAGDAAAIKALNSISTVPVVLRGKSASFSRTLELVAPGGVASLSEKTVKINVTITPAPLHEPAGLTRP